MCILMLPILSLDKIKVFFLRLAAGQSKERRSRRTGLEEPRKGQRGLRLGVSRKHCTVSETSLTWISGEVPKKLKRDNF